MRSKTEQSIAMYYLDRSFFMANKMLVVLAMSIFLW